MDSLEAHWNSIRFEQDEIANTHASFDWDFEMPVVDLGTVIERSFTGYEECTGESMVAAYTELGNVTESGYGVHTFVLAESFVFENGLRSAMTVDEVIAILGEPMRRRDDLMTFAVQGYADVGYSENIRLFFRNQQLAFAWLVPSWLC